MFNARMTVQAISAAFPLSMMLLAGCATPVEVKTASKAQLSLVEALDTAILDLQQALDQFHSDKEARIKEEGRMLVARQAIDALYPQSQPMKQITADALFESYNANVRPWIDNALLWRDIDDQIASLAKQIAGTSNPARKGQLTLDLQDLQEARARIIQNKPNAVAEIEQVILGDLERERQTANSIDQLLEILRAQVAVMKSLATRVDAWLALDVSVSQEQTDSLKEALVGAGKKLGAGGK
jgi:outer membrane murein-binding lipoprotein Lpp